jgi:hypothetical protein
MAFIKSLLIASVATLAVAAPGYEYGSAPAKAVEQPAYGAAPAVQAPAYTSPKPAVKEPEVYAAPKPAVKEPEVYAAPKPAVKEPEVYAAPKPAVKEPEKYAAPTKKAMKQPEYKVDPVEAKAPAYAAEPSIVQTVVIEEAVAPAPAPAVVEPTIVEPAVVEPAVVAAPVVEEEPTTEIDVSSQESAPVCGNDQQLACCNSGEDLIGANCLSIPIRKSPEISNLITFQKCILTRTLQSPSPSSRPAVPTSPRAARPATPSATSSTSSSTALLFPFKRLVERLIDFPG